MKRVFSLALVLFLVILLLATLFVGLFGGASGLPLLRALIFMDVTIPVILYGFLLITKHRSGK
ncbi:cell division protein DIVIC [Stomatobaculum longum]|jgi:hypothetical protein|uniref:cell division protein DIVIC n=1 Tax=Stomatobaculum longum TaxID=796942 RepID=UPI0028DB0B59|nr:cell division protein DIVIC [Stomatobaculum longum]